MERASEFGVRNSEFGVKDTLQEIAGGSFAGVGTHLFVVEEGSHLEIMFRRFRLGKGFCDGVAAREVIEPAGINPFVIKAAYLCGLSIEQLHVKIQKARPTRKLSRQGLYETFLAADCSPQGVQVRLGIHLQAVLVDVSV